MDFIDSYMNNVVEQVDLQLQSLDGSSSTVSPGVDFLYISNMGSNTVSEVAFESIGQYGGCD